MNMNQLDECWQICIILFLLPITLALIYFIIRFCINLTSTRNRKPSQSPAASGECLREPVTLEDTSNSKSILVIDSLECCICMKDIDRGQSFACGTCKFWPLCDECVLSQHLGLCLSYKIMPTFQKRCVSYEDYLRRSGESFYQSISSIGKRLESTLAEAGCLSRVGACNNDPVLRDIIDRKYIGRVDAYRKSYVQASEMYENFASMVSIMNRFADTGSALPDNFSPLEILISGDEKLNSLRDTFEYLLCQDQSHNLNEALKRLENLIRLMTNTSDVVSTTATAREQETKKPLSRSKSYSHNVGVKK